MQQLAVFTQNSDTFGLVHLQKEVTQERAANATVISSLIKSGDMNERMALTIVTGMILSTVNYFNIGRNMNEEQALETAALIIEKFKHESLEDFVLVFKNAKMGKYGTTFNRIDGQVIFEWIGKYMEEKAKYRESVHQKRKAEGLIQEDLTKKISENITPDPDGFLKSLKKSLGYEADQIVHKADEIQYKAFKIKFLTGK